MIPADPGTAAIGGHGDSFVCLFLGQSVEMSAEHGAQVEIAKVVSVSAVNIRGPMI